MRKRWMVGVALFAVLVAGLVLLGSPALAYTAGVCPDGETCPSKSDAFDIIMSGCMDGKKILSVPGWYTGMLQTWQHPLTYVIMAQQVEFVGWDYAVSGGGDWEDFDSCSMDDSCHGRTCTMQCHVSHTCPGGGEPSLIELPCFFHNNCGGTQDCSCMLCACDVTDAGDYCPPLPDPNPDPFGECIPDQPAVPPECPDEELQWIRDVTQGNQSRQDIIDLCDPWDCVEVYPCILSGWDPVTELWTCATSYEDTLVMELGYDSGDE